MLQQSLPSKQFTRAINAVGARQPLLHPFSRDEAPVEIPIEVGYVNLRIVSQDAQVNGGPDVYVDVKNIFNPTADTSAISDNLQKVIVCGQPGTGKSVLCHHIASRWSKGDLWNDRYTGIVWLTFSDFANYDFGEAEDTAELAHLTDMLNDKYFSKTVNFNTEAFLTDNPKKVLFILDGYDEAKDQLQSKNKKIPNQVLKYIAKNFSMIITSRSAEVMIGHEAIVFDHVLENVGFTQENIEHYIEKHLSKKESEKLQSLINNKQDIKNIVSIPLNLYMLCKIWSKNFQVKEIQNVTDLYVEITETLFKEAFANAKPESRKGKEKEDDESTQKKSISAERQEAVRQIHEELALEVMKNNYSSIGDNLLKAKVDKIRRLYGVEDSEKEKLYDDVLNAKVIKIINNKTSGQIVFPHHTFVEFFAAKAIVRYLSTGTSHDHGKVRDLVKEHKYDPYFEIVWIRITGLLYKEYSQDQHKSDLKLQMFFDLIENEPRELIGLKHNTLIAKLLKEFGNASDTLPVFKKLSAYYTRNDQNLSIIKLEAIERMIVLQEYRMESQENVDVVNAKVISDLENIAKNDEMIEARLYATEGLLRIGQTRNEYIATLIHYIRNPEGNLGLAIYCIFALSRANTMTNEVEECLINALTSDKVIMYCDSDKDRRAAVYYSNKCISKYNIIAAEALIKTASVYFDQAMNLLIKKTAYDSDEIRYFAMGIIAKYKDDSEVKSKLNQFLISASNEVKNKVQTMSAGRYYIRPINILFRGGNSSSADGVWIPAIIPINESVIFPLIFASVSIGVLLDYIYPDRSNELDKIILGDGLKNRLGDDALRKIRDITDLYHYNQQRIIDRWSENGLLNLRLAIQLYCSSFNKAWLEPMKDIKFIYKDPSIFLSIISIMDLNNDKQNIIIDLNVKEKSLDKGKLTSTSAETNAVLKAIEQAFKTEKLTNPAINHYLYGTCLDVSGDGKTPKETRYFILRCMQGGISSVPYLPKKATELRAAAAGGNLDKVKQILQDENIDVDDRDPETGNTALMLATIGKHWKVMEYLIEDKNVDVNFHNKDGKVAVNIVQNSRLKQQIEDKYVAFLIEKSSFLNEKKLQKGLIESINSYKLALTKNEKQNVLDQLMMYFTGENKNWQTDRKNIHEYYLNLRAASKMNFEHFEGNNYQNNDVIAKGLEPQIGLMLRLHSYLELFIKIGCKEWNDIDYGRNAIKIDDTLTRLYHEIKILIQTYANEIMVISSLGNKHLFQIKAKRIIEYFGCLNNKEELIIRTGSEGHCIYVGFYKSGDDQILIRIDNRLVSSSKIQKDCIKHGERNIGIKPYLLGVFDLNDNEIRILLETYITGLFDSAKEGRIQFPHIYCENTLLPSKSILYDQLSSETREYISAWSYENEQAIDTNNCTLSSYHLGILTRQGREFSDWLLDKEIKLAIRHNKDFLNKDRNYSSIDRTATVKGYDNNTSQKINLFYSHSTLIEKFQKELNVAYTEVYVGITVEQTLVGLAGVDTRQDGASFRRYNENITKFNLKFIDESQLGKFIDYYNGHYPTLILSSEITLKNGWAMILMNTKILYERVSCDMGRIEKLASEQVSSKWSKKINYVEDKRYDKGI